MILSALQENVSLFAYKQENKIYVHQYGCKILKSKNTLAYIEKNKCLSVHEYSWLTLDFSEFNDMHKSSAHSFCKIQRKIPVKS